MRFALPVALLVASTSAPLPAAPPDVDRILRTHEIEAAAVGINLTALPLMLGDSPRRPFVDLVMAAPLDAPDFATSLAGQLSTGAAAHPVNALATLSRITGKSIRRGLLGNPIVAAQTRAAEPGALAAAMRALRNHPATPAVDEDFAELPASVQRAAALLLFTIADVAEWPPRAYDRPAPDTPAAAHFDRLLRAHTATLGEDVSSPADYTLWLKNFIPACRPHLALVAAEDLCFAVEAARKILTDDPALTTAAFPTTTLDTRLGRVVIADRSNHTHDATGPLLLLLDLGGDDMYTTPVGANAGPDYPISVALDLAGDDTYDTDAPAGSFGAAAFGVGILCDAAGNDRYHAPKNSQASALVGVGLLLDYAGDDEYTCVEYGQSAALAGVALLLDRNGNDRYHAWHQVQAYAGPNAAAALVDLAGNDTYLADDTDIRYPAAQTRDHNSSLAQGCGFGWRADFSDGLSVPGGVAILVDDGGNDTYTCGVFGQATGYWNGAGLLVDRAGNDQYTGWWYVQGASAHFAAAVFADLAGNDTYRAGQNMSQGAGHDVGIGAFLDAAGDDTYYASTLGLGASNAAGVGVFIEVGGDDTYYAPDHACLGWANLSGEYRALLHAWGLFLDLAGADRYRNRADAAVPFPGPRNDQTWKNPDPTPATQRLHGVGIDIGPGTPAATQPHASAVDSPG